MAANAPPRIEGAARYVRPAPVRLRHDARAIARLSPAQRALVGAVVVAMLVAVVYVLWVPAAPAAQRANSVQARASSERAEQVAPQETPAEREARRLARRAAQDAAEPLGRAREAAHALHPEYWDPAGIAAVDELARRAEQAYLAQSYDAAIRDYRAARERYDALTRAGHARRAAAIAAARAAIERGDAEGAARELGLAARIRPGDDARHLAARVRVLPTVLAQIDRGVAAREIEDYEMSRVALIEALRLDPATARARRLLAEVDAARARQRYMSVMNRGFDALQQAEYASAEAAFQAASSYAPAATAVALEQVRDTAVVDELQDLLARGEAALAAERFAEAESLFGKALARDAALAVAQRGAAAASERKAMTARIDAVLAEPGRLSDDSALAAARTTLAAARALRGVGPQLQQRIARLDALLATSAREVAVTLRSDNATTIRVFRVGQLGRFQERTLTLRPGRYAVMGSRDGYRDVRVDIDVRPGMAPVDVRCIEAIR